MERLEALLFRHDPMGSNCGSNSDEYRSEAETITLRRHEAQSEDGLRRMVHEEFVRWFDPETTGAEARYAPVANELWRIWSDDTDE